MNRISRDQLYMEMANLFAKRSTCYRQNIGAVLVHNNRLVSQGYNGPPAGEAHCTGQDCPLTPKGGCASSVHAEVNAIRYCPVQGVTPLTLYVSQSPCSECAEMIIKDGRIIKVFYGIEYRLKTGIEKLLAARIEVLRLTQSGYIINAKDNTLVV